jgi:arylsulfatase A-like enzyme
MLAEIQFVDAAIGQMVDALEDHRLLDSTAIIITAKHGQSPIDPNRFFPIPGNSGTNGMPPSAIISSFQRFSMTRITASESPRTTFPSYG